MRLPVVLTILALAASGCTGGNTPSATDVSPTGWAPATFDDDTGGIQGTILDDALRPLGGAQVEIVDTSLATLSDEAGRFAFSALAPGEYQLRAWRGGHLPMIQDVIVQAGSLLQVHFLLEAVPVAEPHHVTLPQNGLLPCGVSWYPEVFSSGFVASCPTPATLQGSGTYGHQWTFADRIDWWTGLAVETEWQSSQIFSKGLRVYWRMAGPVADADCAHTFDDVRGVSPLARILNASLVDDLRVDYVTSCGEPCHVEECQFRSFLISQPETLGGTSAVDVGITVDQRFTHYVTQFYLEEPEPGFTALRDD